MNRKRLGLSSASWVPFLVVAACAGTRLNDVGDVRGQGGDAESNGGSSSGSTSDGGRSTNGGKNASGKAGSAGTSNGGASGGSGTLLLGGSKGNVGGTSTLPPDEIVSGAGGEMQTPEFKCETCEVVAAAPDIRAIATGSERVFWVEYGSYDGLGNYQDDGRLMSLAFAGGEPTIVAEGLQGPVEVEVSDDFAYVILEQSSAAAGAIELARVPLDTGDVEVLQAVPDYGYDDQLRENVVDWFHRYFVAESGFAFWANGNAVYRLAEGAVTPPEKFLDTEQLFSLVGDDAQLYLYDVEGFKSVPYTGGQPTLIRAFYTAPGIPAYYGLSVVGDYIYGYEWHEPAFISRMPKLGGVWKHLVEIDSPPSQLVIDGDEYFDDRAPYLGQGVWENSLRRGNLSSDSPSVILATSPLWDQGDAYNNSYWRAWDVAPTAVYFGWEGQLYRIPRTP